MTDSFAVELDRLRAHLDGLAGPAQQAITADDAISEIRETNRLGPFDAAYGVINQPHALILDLIQRPMADKLSELCSSITAQREQLGLTVEAYADTELANTRLFERTHDRLERVPKATMRERRR